MMRSLYQSRVSGLQRLTLSMIYIIFLLFYHSKTGFEMNPFFYLLMQLRPTQKKIFFCPTYGLLRPKQELYNRKTRYIQVRKNMIYNSSYPKNRPNRFSFNSTPKIFGTEKCIINGSKQGRDIYASCLFIYFKQKKIKEKRESIFRFIIKFPAGNGGGSVIGTKSTCCSCFSSFYT